jgi:hypothetical protein
MMRSAVALGLVSTLVAGCIPQQVPPPAAPERVMSDLPASAAVVPPAPGKGQVSVDENIGTTTVTDADGNVYDSAVYKPVCSATPCVTNLDFGSHDLKLTSNVDANHSGMGTITVGAQPIDYRYALGHNDLMPHFTSGLFTAVGGATLTMGGLFAYGFTQKPGGLAPSSSWGTAGLISMVIGLAVTALGVHLLSDAGVAQAGTGAQWTVPAIQ